MTREPMTTYQLLKALSESEGQTALGKLADALMVAGDYTVRKTRAEVDAVEDACADVVVYAEEWAEECAQSIGYYMEKEQ